MKEYYYIRVMKWSDYDFRGYVGDHLIVFHPADVMFFEDENDAADMCEYMYNNCSDDYTFEIKRF